MKKLLSISVLFVLMTSLQAKAQIITSKKEAQKKGLYSYSENETTDTASASTGTPATTKATLPNQAAEPQPVKEEPKKVSKKKVKSKKKDKDLRSIIVDEAEDDFEPSPYENYVARQVVNNAMQFEGVRYRTGGTTTDGMDCSGMVYATFSIFDISLPRSSSDMATAGRKINMAEARIGDLLFFDNNPSRRRINHVGLVVEVTDGEIKFIHSALHGGVIISSMNESYYDRTFIQVNRIIED